MVGFFFGIMYAFLGLYPDFSTMAYCSFSDFSRLNTVAYFSFYYCQGTTLVKLN